MEQGAPPKHLHFGGLNPNERVELFLRRHWIIIWQSMLLIFLMGVLPVVAWIIFTTQTDWLVDPQSLVRIGFILATSLFYLFWLRLLFTSWLDYYLDVWVVTNQRIINIEHKGLFHRKMSEQNINRIQDVTTVTRGIWQTLLKFGDIRVQTAAETEHFIFSDIQNPEYVAKRIGELQADAIRVSGQPFSENIATQQQTPTPPKV